VVRVLRLVGITNAAIWFGAVVFYTLFVGPGLRSNAVQLVLQSKNFPYFGGAISQILLVRYFYLHLMCATIALLHLVVERLYFGRPAKGLWTTLFLTMFFLSVLGAFWLGPRLVDLHRAQHFTNNTPAQREAAATSFRKWASIFQAANVFMIGGVAAVLWRAVTPSDELRFVGSGKFRG
jgi:hypothetical protein